jgi:predicted RNA-binding protein YlqC (UPF0109 family)
MCDLKAFIEQISKPLVQNPDAVVVREIRGTSTIIYELRVAPDDMGRVIGKKGRSVNAIRTLVRAIAAREGRRVSLEVV